MLPDQGALGMVKNLIDKDEDLTPQDKETALKLLEQDTIEYTRSIKTLVKRYEITFLALKKHMTNGIDIFNNSTCYFYTIRRA